MHLEVHINAVRRITCLIMAWSHTLVEIDHKIISTVILLLSADSSRAVVSYKRKYVHEVLVNSLVKLPTGKNVVWFFTSMT